MKRNVLISVLLLSIVILIGVGFVVARMQNTVEITAAEAIKNKAAGNYDFVVDVRTKAEWDEGHSPNTISIPIGEFVSELPLQIPNKDARILFVCRKGIRASAVAAMAQKLGYTRVHAMMGNYKELEAAS